MRWKRGLLFTALATLLLTSSAVGLPSPTHLTFTAAGDFGAQPNTRAVLDTMAASGADLALALGDLKYGDVATEAEWCAFVKQSTGEGYPFQLVSGNHESNGPDGNINDFSACLPNQLPGAVGTYGREYYVDVPQGDPLVRFVMISPAIRFADGLWSYDAGTPRYAWTAAAIDGARSADIPWVVVGMHKPCLSVGSYACDIGPDLTNLLLTKKVDLVLAGHEHAYMRTKQLALGPGCPTLAIGSYDADCVVDADNAHAAGAGTVFLTIGTGGISQRDIVSTDPEMPYFSALEGLNLNRSYGAGHFDVTPERIAMTFLRAQAGGTFTDAFTITRDPNAPNVPPTASFTSAPDGLNVAFDASGSSDTDGSVTSYAWSFGDGEIATGVRPEHTFRQAGTYPVTLTVTDDDGATGSITHDVTVQEPPGPEVVAVDAFERVVVGGWGTADVGGAWTVRGPSARFSVSDGAGRMVVQASQSLFADLLGVSRTRTSMTAEFSVDKVAEGTYVAVVGRQVGSDAYVARLRIRADGQAQLYLLQNFNAVASTLLVPNLTIVPGERYRLSLETVGTSPTRLSAKVWKASEPEPATWQRTGTNSFAALQGPGRVGVFTYLPGASSAQSPVSLSFHDLRVVEPPL